MDVDGDESRVSTANLKSLLQEADRDGMLLSTLEAFTRIGLPLTFLAFCVCFSIAGAIIIASYPDD